MGGTEHDILSYTTSVVVVPPDTAQGLTAIAGQVRAIVQLTAGVTGSIVDSASLGATAGFYVGTNLIDLWNMRGTMFFAAGGATCTFRVLIGKTSGQ